MGHLKFIPFGDKTPYDLATTTNKELQLWQEFTMLRHDPRQGIYGKKITAPYVDQAKMYYHDARTSNWKSAGLLYYYSFLNLAKAFLIIKRGISGSTLKSTSIYHGLQANPQNPKNIIDFEVNIHPPISNNKKNIFALFYEKITFNRWPFNSTIHIPLNSIIGHCQDISNELGAFFDIIPKPIELQSLIRNHDGAIWFEIVVPNNNVAEICSYLGDSVDSVIKHKDLKQRDKVEWKLAYERTSFSLSDYSFIRMNRIDNSENEDYHLLQKNIIEIFKDYILPNPTNDPISNNNWIFIPKINLYGQELVWHPLLSNYLFAFVLSTVLRYHPHILSIDNKNTFLAEAWCNQSAVTTLRYFLMNMSDLPTRIN